MMAKELVPLRAAALRLMEAYAEIAEGRSKTGLSMLREATADLLVIERTMREAADEANLPRRPR